MKAWGLRSSEGSPQAISLCCNSVRVRMNVHSGFPDSAPARATGTLQRLRTLLAVCLLLACLPAVAQATLQAWRQQLAEVRVLAENDVPLAYEQALQLQQAMPAGAAPADRVRILNVLARTELYLAETQRSLARSHEAYALALQHGDKIGQAEADLTTSLNAINAARLDELRLVTTRALATLEGTERPDLLGEALLRVSVMYRRFGQLDESGQTALQGMEIARRSRDPLALTYAHQGLAISYDQSFQRAQALEHYSQMREHARLARSLQLEAYALLGVAGQRRELGDAAAAERLIREGHALFERTRAPYAIAFGHTQLSHHLRLTGRLHEAVAASRAAQAIYERHPNRIGRWFTLIAQSELHQLLGDLKQARADAESAQALAREIDFALYLSGSAQRLAAVAAAAGDHRRAHALLVQANEHTARATRERLSASMADLAQRYEAESRRREVAALTQRNREQAAELERAALRQRLLWALLGAGLVITAMSLVFVMRLRRSQQQLRRSGEVLALREQEFRALVEHAPDTVSRYDREGRRVYANPALARVLDVEIATLIGKKPSENPAAPQDEAARFEAAVQAVMHSGVDGSIDVTLSSRAIQMRLVAERDAGGQVVSVLAIGRDVTTMLETQRQLTTLLDNLPDMVARFDSEGRYVYVNPAVTRQFGLTLEQFLGRTAAELGLDHDGRLGEAVQRVLDEGEPNLLEVPSVQPDGLHHYEIRHLPELDERGRVVSVLGIACEVTERRHVEQLRRELGFRREAAREEERKAIARELHDELGQLLSALRFEVSLLRMRFGGTDPGIAERAASMLALVDSVIRMQRDLVSSLRPAVLDLGVAAALEWLVGEFRERSSIDCRLQISESQIELDAEQTTVVFRIVQESLTNVARHAKARHVEVAVRRVVAGYQVSIADDGRGFDLGATRDHKSMGLLGLQDRAQMLGGRLEIDSAPGQGCRVRVSFPALTHSAAEAPEPVRET
jgi:PAS domain S-box-containing protein